MNIKRKLLPGNHAKGRRGHKPLAIVVHIIEGTLSSADNHFRNPKSEVSAHYGVSRGGDVVQWVDDADTAYCNGIVVRPTAQLVRERPGVNPNLWTLSIEHEGYATSEPTREMYAASGALIRELALRHGIPLDRRHVLRHQEIRADKTCPGRISVDELLRIAKPPAVVPRPGARVWSGFFGEYLILTRYVNETEWYFVRESHLRMIGTPAGTPWSQMPLEP